MKLAVLTTHPIQYQVPWFRLLARQPGIELTVLFCHLPDANQQGAGFGVEFQWDIPLLEGYAYRLLHNIATTPSVAEFGGCDTPEIATILRDERFDAVIVNGWVVKSCLQALWACRRYRVPCLVRGESNTLRPRAWYKRWIHRVLLSQYSAFLAIGKSNREFYLQNGVDESRIFMTPYGVDNAWFAAQAACHRGNRPALRRQWGIPEDAFVFLFSGKLIPKKRPQDVIRAMAVAGGGVRSRHLLMVGDGELRAECERLAAEVGTAVTFSGFLNQSEIPAAYACADCLVLPSDAGETWGLVVNEAMACGLPAIVSDHVGCQADLVEEGQTGAVVPLGDVEALGRVMARLAADGAARERMGAAARVRVAEYSYERAVAGTLDALEVVCRRAPRGGATS